MGQKYASFAAKDTREASNLPSDFDGTITSFKFTKEAPDNYEASGNPIFAVAGILQDGDGPEVERLVLQSYSLGAKAGDEFTISDDGYGLIPTGDETAGRKGSKFDYFKCSLENEGIETIRPNIFVEGDMSKLLGVRAHWKRIDDPKRAFQGDQRNKKVSKFPPQTLLCVKLLDAKATTATAAHEPVTQANDGGGGSIDQKAASYLKKVLAKNSTIPRAQIILAVSKAAGANEPDRARVAKRAADESFLKVLADDGVMVGDEPFFVKYDPAATPQTVSTL